MLVAFQRVCTVRSDVRLLLLSSESFERYESLVHRLGVLDRVSIRDYEIDDLPATLVTAKVALWPRTECDGLPQQVLNYMAVGVPIVASTGSAKNLVNGVYGLIVPNDDCQVFADPIVHILQNHDKFRLLAGAARWDIRDRISWDSAAQTSKNVYRKLLN